MPDPELGVQADWELREYGELAQEDRHVEAMRDLDEDRRHERERRDWLTELEPVTARLVEADARRYGPLPFPRPAVEDEARMLEPFHPDCEEAA